MVSLDNVATSVLSHVISSYPHRQEAMCDAGGIAMARDSGPTPGFGRVVWPERLSGWDLGRMSQEHGTLVRREDSAPEVELGELIRIVGQHSW
jgi:D-serine deaminase-like pyridoxal phosphate-dependent protein